MNMNKIFHYGKRALITGENITRVEAAQGHKALRENTHTLHTGVERKALSNHLRGEAAAGQASKGLWPLPGLGDFAET